MNWLKAKRYSIALSDKEEKQFQEAKAKGFGIKKIFKAMLDALVPVEEDIDDGKNKSSIMLNVEEEI